MAGKDLTTHFQKTGLFRAKFFGGHLDEASLRRGKKVRRWQKSLQGQQALQLSVPASHRGSLVSLDDIQVFHRSRSMCSMRLDTISLNMELFGGPGNLKSSDDGVRCRSHCLRQKLFFSLRFLSQMSQKSWISTLLVPGSAVLRVSVNIFSALCSRLCTYVGPDVAVEFLAE
jgi:hypothetical protein